MHSVSGTIKQRNKSEVVVGLDNNFLRRATNQSAPEIMHNTTTYNHTDTIMLLRASYHTAPTKLRANHTATIIFHNDTNNIISGYKVKNRHPRLVCFFTDNSNCQNFLNINDTTKFDYSNAESSIPQMGYLDSSNDNNSSEVSSRNSKKMNNAETDVCKYPDPTYKAEEPSVIY